MAALPDEKAMIYRFLCLLHRCTCDTPTPMFDPGERGEREREGRSFRLTCAPYGHLDTWIGGGMDSQECVVGRIKFIFFANSLHYKCERLHRHWLEYFPSPFVNHCHRHVWWCVVWLLVTCFFFYLFAKKKVGGLHQPSKTTYFHQW